MTEPIPVAVHDPGLAPLPVQVSPNPFDQSTVFSFDNISQGRFRLYDAQGRLLREAPVSGNTFELDRGDLPEGVYFYHLSEASGRSAVII